MKQALTVFTTLFIYVAASAQTLYTIDNNRIPGNALATQIAPGTKINVTQNPVRGAINFQITNPLSTKYEISLYSPNGQKITSILYEHPAGTSLKTMYVPDGVKGIYYLVVRSESEKQTAKILVE